MFLNSGPRGSYCLRITRAQFIDNMTQREDSIILTIATGRWESSVQLFQFPCAGRPERLFLDGREHARRAVARIHRARTVARGVTRAAGSLAGIFGPAIDTARSSSSPARSVSFLTASAHAATTRTRASSDDRAASAVRASSDDLALPDDLEVSPTVISFPRRRSDSASCPAHRCKTARPREMARWSSADPGFIASRSRSAIPSSHRPHPSHDQSIPPR